MPRLPSDSVLIVADGDAAVPDSLATAWSDAPMATLVVARELSADALVARLEERGVTTAVVCGAAARGLAPDLAAQGFRIFVLEEEGGAVSDAAVRGVTLTALLAEVELVRRRAGRPWRARQMTN